MNGAWSSAEDAFVNKNHLITDNMIHDYGRRVGHGSGVWFYQAGNTKVLYNQVQEGPRDAFGLYGVRFGGGTQPGMSKGKARISLG
jgi:hypothetical protein